MRNFLRLLTHEVGQSLIVAIKAGRGLPGLPGEGCQGCWQLLLSSWHWHDFDGTCWNSGFIELSFVETWKHKAARNCGSCFIICLPGRPPSSQTRRALGMIFFSQNQILIYKKNIKELSRPFSDNTYIGFHSDIHWCTWILEHRMSHLPYLYSETNTRPWGSNNDPTDHPVRFGSVRTNRLVLLFNSQVQQFDSGNMQVRSQVVWQYWLFRDGSWKTGEKTIYQQSGGSDVW